ncbi:hypothetical protein SAMN04487852_103333 [Prevotella sp. tf2-5]|nr:hypothetical protein SAMN04487852_103333 [Prevotella sp. tf2-5]
MSQKFIKIQNTNPRSSACGKYFATALLTALGTTSCVRAC